MPTATPTGTLTDDPDLDRVFRALGDRTRRAIIIRLTQGEATMSEIAEQFDMSMPGVSKHVGVLEEAGLVHRWRVGRSRRCRLRVEQMNTAGAWLTDQTRFWNETLEALADFVETDEAR